MRDNVFEEVPEITVDPGSLPLALSMQSTLRVAQRNVLVEEKKEDFGRGIEGLAVNPMARARIRVAGLLVSTSERQVVAPVCLC